MASQQQEISKNSLYDSRHAPKDINVVKEGKNINRFYAGVLAGVQQGTDREILEKIKENYSKYRLHED